MADTISRPVTPHAQADEATKHKDRHTPPDEQLRGGSWELDTVTGTYHMISSTIRDGQMLPSPAHPSVYDKFYRVAAEMARAGDYTLARTFPPPESYLEPYAVPDNFMPTIEVKEKLCLECSVIVDRLQVGINLATGGRKHHLEYARLRGQLDMDLNIKSSIDELSRSANDGCVMCAYFFGELEKMPTSQLERHIKASGSRDFPIQIVGIPGPGEHYYRLIIWFRNSQEPGLYGRTKAFEMCVTVPKDPAKYSEYDDYIGMRLSHHFLSDTTIQFLQLWLDECVNEHLTCNAYRLQKPRPPTRLIHVGDAFHEPRLVDTSYEDRVDYLTLSYCWGKSWNSRTMQANLEKHKVGISMEELSPTIRHAILLTRHLGIKYLWVDSLCIIQDLKNDWDAESVRMADIYRDSILTIAAPSASTSMQGIFPEVSQRRLPLIINSETRPVSLYIGSVPHTWDACIEESALSSRGWVLQERLLSCRTLFFSNQQMFWECKTKRTSQHQYFYPHIVEINGIKQVPESVFNKVPELSAEHQLPLRVQGDDEKPKYLTWYHMIMVYSSKMLTVPSDKLPALAGIAQAFEPRDDVYIAGTWMNDWLGGLLWQPIVSKSLKQPHNLDYPRAPSWSWVRLDGEVAFPFSSPNHGFSERLRTGLLDIDEAMLAESKAAEANPIISETKAEKGGIGKEPESNDGSPDVPLASLPDNEDLPNTANEETVISLQVDEMVLGGLARITAELLSVGHKTSDYLGKETSIALTIRGHAESVVGVSSTVVLEPPSSLNNWIGTYDEFTGNWEYSLDQEGLEEPFTCLRMIMCSTTRRCWALLLRQRPDSNWERIGTGTANSYLVDFSNLAEAPKETVILC